MKDSSSSTSSNDFNDPNEYLMNIASVLFFLCYIPDFYANYKNKNANVYNVFEKIVLLAGSVFGLAYSMKSDNKALIINYVPMLTLDTIALIIRSYYAYRNRYIDVTVNFVDTNKNNSVGSPIFIVHNNNVKETDELYSEL
jgi:uncharacterized protein with PQ loop repeat